ncbi:hypothetical protein QFZ71_002064 [Streptomyces sp. V2I9]|nr:hypothetical protein [Streptomyces sp. V2I9]
MPPHALAAPARDAHGPAPPVRGCRGSGVSCLARSVPAAPVRPRRAPPTPDSPPPRLRDRNRGGGLLTGDRGAQRCVRQHCAPDGREGGSDE